MAQHDNSNSFDRFFVKNQATLSSIGSLAGELKLLHGDWNRLRTPDEATGGNDDTTHVDDQADAVLQQLLGSVENELAFGIQLVIDVMSVYPTDKTDAAFARLKQTFTDRSDVPVRLTSRFQYRCQTDDLRAHSSADDDEYRRAVRAHYDWLVWKLAAYNLVGGLFERNAISKSELDSIQKHRDEVHEANKTLLKILLSRPSDGWIDAFKALLIKNNQDDVFLKLEGISLTDTTAGIKFRWVIQHNYVFLVETMVAVNSNLLCELYSTSVLNDREKQSVECHKETATQNEKLLTILYCKTHKMFDIFLKKLDATGQQMVADKLRETINYATSVVQKNAHNTYVHLGDVRSKSLPASDNRQLQMSHREMISRSLDDAVGQQINGMMSSDVKDAENAPHPPPPRPLAESDAQHYDVLDHVNDDHVYRKLASINGGLALDSENAPFGSAQLKAQLNTLCRNVYGVTNVGHRIYVIHSYSNRVVVFADKHPYEKLDEHHIVVDGLRYPHDIVACSSTRQLFVVDYGGTVWRVKLMKSSAESNDRHGVLENDKPACRKEQSQIDTFVETGYLSCTMSAAKSRRLLVTPAARRGPLCVYDVANAHLLQSVELPSIMDPLHAVETQRGTFVVCHRGGGKQQQQRVSEVDGNGRVIHAYDGGDSGQDLGEPEYLAVSLSGCLFVADWGNGGRIVLLNEELRFVTVLSDKNEAEVTMNSRPRRLCYAQQTNGGGQLLMVGLEDGNINLYGC